MDEANCGCRFNPRHHRHSHVEQRHVRHFFAPDPDRFGCDCHIGRALMIAPAGEAVDLQTQLEIAS